MNRPRVVLLHGIQSGPSTFWRVGADLETLGCAVRTPTLPGNAGRPALPASPAPTIAALADAVAAELDAAGFGRALVVGHSLGGLVALALAARRPDLVTSLVLEDPPCRAAVDLTAMRTELRQEALEARQEPDRLIARLLAEQPTWARPDAEHAAENRAAIDEDGVLAPLETDWSLPALAAAAVAVPVTLLAATRDSALVGADRAALVARADTALEIASGHGIHRDRPGVWTAAVLRAAGAFPSGADRPVA